jgi:O-antigen/teichoic acid export membrane protein
LLAFPLCALMGLAIQPLVAALLGPVWQPAGEAALPLIALTAWLFLAFPAGVAVIARGEARYVLIANLAGVAATVAGVMVLRPATPVAAVLVWLGAQVFVSPYILAMNARVLRTSLFRPLRAGVPLMTTSMLATVTAFLLPRLVGESHSPTWLLFERLSVVAMVGIMCALMAGTLGLIQRPRAIDGSGSPR